MPQKRFFKATDKLINAFITGNLEHGLSCSCAVGSLCDNRKEWYYYKYAIDHRISTKNIAHTIAISGYSAEELWQIEKFFEGRSSSTLNYRLKNSLKEDPGRFDYKTDPDGFKGLCEVFDYMVSIEDFSEEESKVDLIAMCMT